MAEPNTIIPPAPAGGVVRRLECCCCGGDAGRWQQWWNRDAGYGLCGRCATWIATRETKQDRPTAEEMNRCYGIEGVHRQFAEVQP